MGKFMPLTTAVFTHKCKLKKKNLLNSEITFLFFIIIIYFFIFDLQ